MDLYEEFFGIVRALNEAEIPYAVVGGLAVSIHTRPRFTNDVDLLFTPETFPRVEQALNGLGYEERAEPWTFAETEITLRRFTKFEGEEHLAVDVMLGHDKRHRLIVEKALQRESADGAVAVAQRDDLVWMKSFRNNEQDRVDLEALQRDEGGEDD